MANVIKHKRGSGSDPGASDLILGELAIRTDTGKLFTKMDSGAIAEIAGGGSDIAINTLSSSSGTGGGSATFNGSAYRFTLSAPPNVSAAQLLVSINGVIQKPVAGTGQPSEGFSVDGTDIILGDAPETGSDFFILTFKSLGVSEPADNSVTSAKIVDGAIVNADVNASAAIAGTKISPDFGSQAITTTGKVLIGTTTEGAANADELTIESAGNTGMTLRSPSTGSGNIFFSDATSGTGEAAGFITYGHNNGDLLFGTDTDERMRIDSSGNVSIGEDDAEGNRLLIRAASTVGTNKGHIMLTGDSATNGQGPQIVFSESGSGSNFAGAYIGHSRSGSNSVGNLVFGTRATGGDASTIPTERMRIDSAGNIMFGTTSNSVFDDTSGSGVVIRGATGALDVMRNNDHPLLLNRTGGDGQMIMFHRDGVNKSAIAIRSNSLCLDMPSGTEKMRIDSSGNVGIGTTSPAVPFHVDSGSLTVAGIFDNDDNTAYSSAAEGHFNNVLQLMSTTTSGQTAQSVGISFNLSLSGQTGSIQEIGAVRTGNGKGKLVFRTRHSTYGRTERVMFGDNADVIFRGSVNNTSNTEFEFLSSTTSPYARFNHTANNAGHTFIQFRSAASQVGEIKDDGDGTITYSTTSDYRLKENIVDLSDAITRLKNLKPRRFNFKVAPSYTKDGFLAHELQEVVPEAVQGTKDEVVTETSKANFPSLSDKKVGDPVYQTADVSRVVPLLVASLQEAIAKIESLETKVAALEAK